MLKAAVRRFAIISFRYYLSDERRSEFRYQMPIMDSHTEQHSTLETSDGHLILFDQNIGPLPVLEKQSHLLPTF